MGLPATSRDLRRGPHARLARRRALRVTTAQNKLTIESLMDLLAERVAGEVGAALARAGNGGGVRARLRTVEQAAIYLGRTEEAVRHLVSSGKLPKVQADRRIQLDIADLDAWIAANKTS